jgi:uncharacterized protein HemX
VNTDISEYEPEVSDVPEATDKQPRSGSGLAFLALLIALLALAGTAYLWWLNSNEGDEGAGRIAAEIQRLDQADASAVERLGQLETELGALPVTDASAQIAGLVDRAAAGDRELATLRQMSNDQMALSRSLQTTIEAQQARLAAAETGLANLAGRGRGGASDLNVAEVDYLLRLANERLKLFMDPVAADRALQMADAQLEAMDNPLFLAVRQRIAESRQTLDAVELPDHIAITAQLDAIQSALATFSFKGENAVSAEPVPASEGSAEAGWWEKIKSVFSGLVTVRRNVPEDKELLTLEDKDYIRQRLWLQMEIARLSLMRKDQEVFRSSLLRADASLQEWFEPEAEALTSARVSLEQLLELNISPQMPDISGAWTTLNMIEVSPVRAPPPQADLMLDPMPDLPQQKLIETEDEDAAGSSAGSAVDSETAEVDAADEPGAGADQE